MRPEPSIQTHAENSAHSRKKDIPKQTPPDGGGSNWQLYMLLVIMGFGILMLILKSLGIV